MSHNNSDRTEQNAELGTETHRLQRQTWVSEIEIYELAEDGDLEVSHCEQRGPVKNETTLECTCGREFEDWDRAAEHLQSVSVEVSA